MNIKCTNIDKNYVSIYDERLVEKINDGAVVVLRVHDDDVDHYCLLTKIDDDYVYLFDPYYLDTNYYDNDDDVEIIKDHPFEFNRKVKKNKSRRWWRKRLCTSQRQKWQNYYNRKSQQFRN